MRNAFKYVKLYSNGQNPLFEEGDVFKCFIPLVSSNQVGNKGNRPKTSAVQPSKLLEALQGLTIKDRNSRIFSIYDDLLLDIGEIYTEEQLNNKVRPYLEYKDEYWEPILAYCTTPKSRREIFEEIGLSNQTKNLNNILLPLVEHGFVQRTIPDRITSSNQKYFTTAQGRIMLNLLSQSEQE